MEFKQRNAINELACKADGRFAVYISNNLEFAEKEDKEIWEFVKDELNKIAPSEKDYYEYLFAVTANGMLFFDTKDEAWKFYKIFEAELTDSSAIYAAIYSPTEGGLTENT